jgi:hypothetical protein
VEKAEEMEAEGARKGAERELKYELVLNARASGILNVRYTVHIILYLTYSSWRNDSG